MEQDAKGVLPLKGIRVLDVASFIAAPVAATILADYGADVIKVEPPTGGDPNRHMRSVAAYPDSEVNYPWHMDSRGKRSLAIDLKNKTARSAFETVIASADVLVTNLPVAARARLSLDYETVSQAHPKLIYAAFTGYGESGPDADQMGFDINAYFARSGILDGARYDDGWPAVAMPAQGDRSSGVTLALAVMMALWHRQTTDTGTLVTSSLLGNGIWANGILAQGALIGAPQPKRPPPDRPRAALSNVYKSRDGRWLQLTLVREDRDWPTLCAAIGQPELPEDPRFSDLAMRRKNTAALAAIVAEALANKDIDDWGQIFKAHNIAFSVLNRAADLPRDEQVLASGAVVETSNPDMPKTLAAPFALANVALPPPIRGPDLGEHSQAILREAGVDDEVISELKRSGAIATSD